MRLFTYVSAFLSVFVSTGYSHAADQNGYTAQYECRAGNPNCNIDVAALTSRACDHVITTSDGDWAKIHNNPNSQVFCLAPGDHRSKGPLVLTSSGSASARKVVRYSGSNNLNPWKQSDSDRAKILRLELVGGYWLLDRLAIDGAGASQNGVFFRAGTHHNLLSRMLVERHHGYQVIGDWNGENYGNMIQNSVLRKASPDTQFEADCIDVQLSVDMRFVNNEAYDCHKALSVGSGVPNTRGLVVENNDFYVSTEHYTDCNGNYNGTGPCSGSEGIMSIKAGGIEGSPAMYVHNRMWGGRTGDGYLVGFDSTGNGTGISISASAADNPGLKSDYVLFQNNIVMDSQKGITGWWGPDTHISIIGNVIYNIRAFNGSWPSIAVELNSKQDSEFYLNTIIDTDMWMYMGGSSGSGGVSSNNDLRCNVVINGGASNISPGPGTEFDNNAFYNTALYTTGSTSSNIVGASADGANTAEFCFYRKLQTGPERACIPRARSTTSSPHYKACNSGLGSRRGVGINDAAMF